MVAAEAEREGAVADGTVVEDVKSAARIFGDLVVSTYAKVAGGFIFEVQPGTPAPTGGCYVVEPMFFAVLVKSDDR